MRKKRIKVLFFSSGAKLTSEEYTLHRSCKDTIRSMYDEETTDIHVLVRNSAVPQHIEPCDYVCGQIPAIFSHIPILVITNTSKTVKKKEIIENVHQ